LGRDVRLRLELPPEGTGETPLQGWIAFEATNTLEGTSAPVPFSTTARSNIITETAPDGVSKTVDEEASTFPIDPAPLQGQLGQPDLVWTATGGPVNVRQALGTKMAPVPAGRTGGLIQVNGSLYVEASLGEGASTLKLALDCTSGEQQEEGASHSDRLSTPLGGTFRAPNYGGAVGGAPLTGAVDAAITATAVPRAGAGAPASVSGSTLDLRLTAAQVTAWLGNTPTATPVTGTLQLLSDRATPSSQSVPVTASVTPPAAGQPSTVSIPVPTTQWTPTGTTGADVRVANSIVLTAGSGAGAKTLTLTRNTAFAAPAADRSYPFVQILGPDPRVRFDEPVAPGTPGVDNPPVIDTGGSIAPPPVFAPPVTTPAPVVTPKPVAKTTSVRIASSSLKRTSGRLKVSLANLVKTAGTTGRFSLVTKTKYKVGKAKKAKRITLLKATTFSLAKGRSRTYAVKLTKDGAALLKARKSVKATLTVTPTKNITQKTVTRSVTVRR